jgi:triose/dihydroxyacetone kinase / FAD-AMP lyase (cyclizing)
MVNNLGATTEMELAIVARHRVSFRESEGFKRGANLAGTFLPSLDMSGISTFVLGINDEWLRCLDAAITALSWPNVLKERPKEAEAERGLSSSSGEGAQTEGGRIIKSRAIKLSWGPRAWSC